MLLAVTGMVGAVEPAAFVDPEASVEPLPMNQCSSETADILRSVVLLCDQARCELCRDLENAESTYKPVASCYMKYRQATTLDTASSLLFLRI